MDPQRYPKMKRGTLYWIVCLALFTILVIILIVTKVFAQQNTRYFKTEAEYRAWVTTIENGLESKYGSAEIYPLSQVEKSLELQGVSAGCLHSTVAKDPATAGPLTANSPVAQVIRNFCDDPLNYYDNTSITDVGSSWYGEPGKTQRVFGGQFFYKDGVLEGILAFDETNDPNTTPYGLTIPIDFMHKYDLIRYEVKVEENVRMLPDNSGPDTVTTQWFANTKGVEITLVKDGPEDGVFWELYRRTSSGGYTLEEASGAPDTNDELVIGPIPEGEFNAKELWNQLPDWNIPISPDEPGYFIKLERGHTTETLVFKNREGKVTGCKTLEDKSPVVGIVVALFSDKGYFVANDTTGSDGCYEIGKVAPGMYFVQEAPLTGMTPVSPDNGKSDLFEISRESWQQVVNFVNKKLLIVDLPFICRNCGGEKARVCNSRSATLIYTDHFGIYQTTQLSFAEGSADVRSIGTLPYGTKVYIAMNDGQPLKFASLKYVDPSGAHYNYPKYIGLGPEWTFVGVFERDNHIVGSGEFRVEPPNAYFWAGYFYEGDNICWAEVDFQHDPE